jgi:acetylornithine deacetylase/succinyl-diaminopimelate desuccinylase-like protein
MPTGGTMQSRGSGACRTVNAICPIRWLRGNLQKILSRPEEKREAARAVVRTLTELSVQTEAPIEDIISGAGRDAVYMARIAPAAMIFVPCVGGISHNEIEDAKPADLTAGCNVLLNAVLETVNPGM